MIPGLILSFFTSFALPVTQVQAALPEGVCSVFYRFLAVEHYRAQSKYALAAAYENIFLGNQLNTEPFLENLAFYMLKKYGANHELLDHWAKMKSQTLHEAFLDLYGTAPDKGQQIMASVESWEQWMQERKIAREKLPSRPALNFRPSDLAEINKLNEIVAVGDLRIKRPIYDLLLKTQSDLEAKGVHTELTAGPTLKRTNSAILVVKSVDAKQTIHSLQPATSVFESAMFQKFLTLANATGGSIVVDPSLLGFFALFEKNSEKVPGKLWTISLNSKSDGSHFVHEWQHKLDLIDNKDGFEKSQTRNQVPDTRTSALGIALRRTGEFMEITSALEEKATAAQFRLYFETKKFPPGDVAETIVYWASNARKTAIGRIFMDPTNPTHYVLYLKSRAVIYIPIATALGTIGELMYFLYNENHTK